jgi:dual specificity phosphatase 12
MHLQQMPFCRYELATREHMLDHGQLGPATPAVGSPAASRRPSALSSHRPSMSQSRPHMGAATDPRPRRSSLLSFGDSLSMSALDTEDDVPAGDGEATAKPKLPFASTSLTRRLSIPERPGLRGFTSISNNPSDPVGSMSALEDSDDEYTMPSIADTAGRISYFHNPTGMSDETAREIGRRMSDAMISSPAEIKLGSEKGADRPDLPHDDLPAGSEHYPPTHLFTPAELAAQLHANPKLAALRSPMAMTPLQPSSTKTATPISPPILINPKCSGYFVEPVGVDSFIVVRFTDALVDQMKWMESFLESGQLAGKILCPNTKCGAKLGNFDWAGVRCGCKEWVTPVGIRIELLIYTPGGSCPPCLPFRDSASIDQRWTRSCENNLTPAYIRGASTSHSGSPSGVEGRYTYMQLAIHCSISLLVIH